MKKSSTTLAELLVQDNHQLVQQSGSEYKCICWEHEDTNPSMSINDVEGVYYCFSCGASGNAYTYLISERKLTPKQAVALLGWSDDRVELAETEIQSAKTRLVDEVVIKTPKLHPEPSKTNWDGGRMVAQYDYMNDGELFCTVVKYDEGRKIMPFTPVAGGYYCCWPTSKKIPHKQRAKKLILFGVDELKKLPVGKQQVWVVEGEKDVLSVRSEFPVKIVVSAPSGTHIKKSLDDGEKYQMTDYVDWSPLFGHRILLISDADSVGRNYMRTLGKYLHSNHCEVRLSLPSGNDKFDISDAINSGRTSGNVFKAVEKWINSCAPIDVKTILETERQEIKRPSSSIASCDHYRILGLGDEKNVWFRIFATNEILSFGRSGLTDMRNLILIAPPEYWFELAGGVTSINASASLQIASSLIRCAEELGMVSWDSILGIGGVYDKAAKKYYYNLGDRILVCDKNDNKMTEDLSIGEVENIIFSPGKQVKMIDRPDGAELLEEFTTALSKYRWDTPDCFKCVLGWIVTSIVGGALPWRPNVWLLAGTDTGKSHMIENFIQPLFVGLGETFVYPTDAGINQKINSSSVPVILDEFESGKQGIPIDMFMKLLMMIRFASGNVGVIARGSPTGRARQTNSRFSSLVLSVTSPAEIPPQDENRFAYARLSPRPVANYLEIERAILSSLAGDKAIAIRSHIIRHTPEIVAKYEHLCGLDWAKLETPRDVKILGALSAGYWFASGKKEIILSRDRSMMDFASDTKSAALLIVESILLAKIKYPDKPGELTIANALKNRYDFAGEYGVRLAGGGGDGILIAIGSKQISTLLRGTMWENLKLADILRAYQDIKPEKSPVRFGQFTHRCVKIPEFYLEEIGFSTLITDADRFGERAGEIAQHWHGVKN